LPGAQHEDFGGEGFEVGGVGTNHCEFVVCDGEEERLIECSIDDTKKVGLAGMYWDNGGVCMKPKG